jgi:hypothetical protein
MQTVEPNPKAVNTDAFKIGAIVSGVGNTYETTLRLS